MAALAEKLDAEEVEYARIGRVALFLSDLSKLGFRGMDLNVIMVSHPPADEEEAKEHARLLGEYKSAVKSVGFCFHVLLSEAQLKPNQFVPSSLEPVYIYGEDLDRLFSSRVPASVLFEVVRRQVNLHRLCPFNTTHEARGAMFKGRIHELTRLTGDLDTHFVVSGARRIGKTSLLLRAYDTLRVREEFKGRTFYFNCLTWGGQWDCFSRLAHAVSPRREDRITKSTQNVSYMLERAGHGGTKPLLLFFDEIDRIVDTDSSNDWPFFNVLYEAAGAKWVRLVFAGYRSTSRLTVGRDAQEADGSVQGATPFHGALEAVALGKLSDTETASLVVEPLRSSEVSVRDEVALRDEVQAATKGYPFLIQFFGERLYRHAVERTPQEVLPDDVARIATSFELADFLETHFLENTVVDGRPADVERACAFLFASRGDEAAWAEGNFVKACRDELGSATLDDVHDALRNLVHANVLSYEAGRYSFTFPLLRRILCEAYPDVDVFMESLGRN